MSLKQQQAQTTASDSMKSHEVSIESKRDDPPSNNVKSEADVNYPTGVKLAIVLLAVYMTMFLVVLDRLIIATAIPRITDEFDSTNDIGWYGSAFFLTNCAFQLLFGKMYTLYNVRGVFLTSLGIFEVGSAVCGAAPSSVAFIIGRAVAGVGAAGVSAGIISIIAFTLPLHKRASYQGLFGALTGVASIFGPLVGGAFTTHVSWRWCFYINLPLGAAAAVVVLLFMSVPAREPIKTSSMLGKVAQLDIPGTAAFIPAVTALLLALQWGGITYAWNNGRIIALLVIAVVLAIAFACSQVLLPQTATIAPRILTQRSIVAAAFVSFTMGAQMMVFGDLLPAPSGSKQFAEFSAVRSGILTLPLIMPMVVGTLAAGFATRKIGYYMPFLIGGICLMSTGAGLLTTLNVQTNMARLVGYQILYGIGLGLAQQAPSLAAQTCLQKNDIPVGASLIFLAQLLGGTIFISVGTNVLDTQLIRRLSSISSLDAQNIVNAGATALTNVSAAEEGPVLVAYNDSLRHVFIMGLVLACVSILGALGMEWRSMRPISKGTSVESGNEEDGESTKACSIAASKDRQDSVGTVAATDGAEK